MENKLKILTRTLIIGFLLFSIYTFVTHDDSTAIIMNDNISNWLIISYIIGFFMVIIFGVGSIFVIAGIGSMLLQKLLGWAFNTDFFD